MIFIPGVILDNPLDTSRKLSQNLASLDVPCLAIWSGMANPAEAQESPSCGGHAIANVLEIMIRRDAPEDWLHCELMRRLGQIPWQIDGERIWRELRLKHYGNLAGGLKMEEVANGPRDIGINEFNVHMVEDPMIAAAIGCGPMVAGLAISSSWEKPDAKTGYIRPVVPNPFAGHAVAIVGAQEKDNGVYIIIQNSWGPNWGVHGYGILNFEYYSYCKVSPAIFWDTKDVLWYRSSKLWEYIIPAKHVS